ncbi:hypothetical protein O6H91_Y535200 [Diphasiastrum complanatum]|nr:hypothetical protein O6H91_Y535200 [Diphasiastrum complanatum]
MFGEIRISGMMNHLRLKNLILRKSSKNDNNGNGPVRNGTSSGRAKSLDTGAESLAASGDRRGFLPGPAASQSDISNPMPLARNSISVSVTSGGVAVSNVEPYLSPSSAYNFFFESLPSLRDVPSPERHDLVVRKLGLCCYVFDFTDPAKNVREKEIKRQTLLELVDYVTSATGKFTESTIDHVTKMVSVNLFRAFPPSYRTNCLDSFDVEDEHPSTMDPAWPHLQIVYEFLLRFVVSPETEPKIAKRYMNQSFLLKLLNLFDSEEPREREYLKTILHRVYGKFMVYRPFIRKAINNIFLEFIFETEKHNGIAELLEILGSIIDGFAVPLKEEHKLFLVRALIPLHKPKSVAMYHQQLSYCIAQFIEKDSKLADVVIRGLLKYWPMTNSQKEVLFLGELGEVLADTQAAEFQKCIAPLFIQISRCLKSANFQVAERALFLWNDEHTLSLIAQNRHLILPIIFNSLEMNTNRHWNPSVKGLTLNVRKMFCGLDPDLYEECHRKFQVEEQDAKLLEKKQENLWKRLEVVAASGSLNSAALLLAPGLDKLLL